jgi:AraC family transcriptional regulator
MEDPPQSVAARRVEYLGAVTDFRIGKLGHVTSPLGVRLTVTQCLHDGRSESRLVTDDDTALFRFSMRMPKVVELSVAGQPLRSCGLLGYCGPGVAVEVAGKGRHTTAWCGLGSGFLASLSETHSGLQLKGIELLHSINSEPLRNFGRAIFREAIEPGFCSSLFAEAIASTIVLEIARYNGARRLDDGEPRRGGLAPWQLRRLDDHIRAHLSENLTLHEMARLLGMSVRHLTRAVRQSRGMSLHHWIADYRLAEARRMLSDTDLPVNEIALRSGFLSASAFSTAFRAATAFSPGEYRRLNRVGSAWRARSDDE